MRTIETLLKNNAYPGRGILLGRSPDGKTGVILYFIMGRSENSRNRVFVTDGDGIRTQAFDPSRLSDPSLIIYSPVRVCNDVTVVTNGDQTDTIYDFLCRGNSFEDALRTREFEPDKPNYTPRISGLMRKDGAYRLSILKSAEGNPDECLRFFFEYENPVAGQGHLIHTYEGDGNPLPSFVGEPRTVAVDSDLPAFAKSVWESLDENNKVSLFARFIELGTGRQNTMIFNKKR